MSFSPKHTTSFSVTDILSPIEESYKKTTIEASIPPLVPAYRNHSQQTAANMNGTMTSPYNYVQQLSHPASSFPPQYCNSSDLSHYGDPMQARNTAASWYAASSDPRLASKYHHRAPRSGVTRVTSGGVLTLLVQRVFSPEYSTLDEHLVSACVPLQVCLLTPSFTSAPSNSS